MAKQKISFGLWSSPIKPEALARQVRFEDLWFDSKSHSLIWLEGRNDKGVLVRKQGNNAPVDLTTTYNVRGTVGYGGGGASLENGNLVFSERNGQIFLFDRDFTSPRAITPAFGEVASPVISPDGRYVIFVFSDGKKDLLGLVETDGEEWPIQLARGADFYLQPCWNPTGEYLAWIEWDHPCMPWDGSRLMLAEFQSNLPHIRTMHTLAGDAETPISQPSFSPDGVWLSYISANDDWEMLNLYNIHTGEKRELLSDRKFQLALPAWVQGMHSYGWNHDSKSLIATLYQGAEATLVEVNVDTGTTQAIETGEFCWFTQLATNPIDDSIAVIASAPATPQCILVFKDHSFTITARSELAPTDADHFSTPAELKMRSKENPVYGIFYPPHHPDAEGIGLPPAILHIHGGPTSQASNANNMLAAYFTSRGYAWLEVNYHGTSGYGRKYRDALLGNWGELDTEDVLTAAEYLITHGMADPKKLILMGGSAGGLTVLNALISKPGMFKAAICLYGVSDLFKLATETHKFEAQYLDRMIGPLPQEEEKYQKRSPIFHMEGIRDPMAIFQGADDKVVPPSQSQALVVALKRNQVPHLFRLFEGEGHGFRKAETIREFLVSTEGFLKEQVLNSD